MSSQANCVQYTIGLAGHQLVSIVGSGRREFSGVEGWEFSGSAMIERVGERAKDVELIRRGRDYDHPDLCPL